MNQPDQTALRTVEAAQQMRQAAKAMRDLANGLDQYASTPSFTAINKMRRDLGRIGWNALYTSLLLADLAEVMQEVEDCLDQPDASSLFQDLDALFTAVNYFSKSLAHLKGKTPDGSNAEAVKIHLADLSIRLKEVARECKSI